MNKFKPKFTFLLTCVGGGLVSQNILYAKSSEEFDVEIIAVDFQKEVSSSFIADYYYSVPSAEDQNYVSRMLEICKKHNVNLVLPGSDAEALILSEERKIFEAEGILICAADYNTLKILNDKNKTYEELKKIRGISSPQWKQVFSKEEIIHTASCLHRDIGDIVIKPSLSRGGRDIIVVSDQYKEVSVAEGGRELYMNFNRFKEDFIDQYDPQLPVIIMEKLESPVHDIDILSMVGKAHRIVPRKRLHSAAPNLGHILIDDSALTSLAQKVIEHFNLSWLQDIDVMFDKNGSPYILEVNPRPSGSFAISVAAGIPFFEDLIYLSQGKSPKPIAIDYNKKIVPFTSLYPTKK